LSVPHAPGLGVPCPHCGQAHTRCIGHRESKTDGHVFPCGRVNSDGHVQCYAHGGPRTSKARQRARKAAIKPRAKAVNEVLATLTGLGIDVSVTDPLDALIAQLSESAAVSAFLLERCRELGVDTAGDLLVGPERLSMHPLWLAWREESDRTAKFAELALRAGVAERQVRVIEQQASLFADLLRRVLDDPALGLTPDQRQIGRRVAASQLRLVASS
jgi:hypothetical protein